MNVLLKISIKRSGDPQYIIHKVSNYERLDMNGIKMVSAIGKFHNLKVNRARDYQQIMTIHHSMKN